MRLNCLQATAASAVIEIQVVPGAGSVRIVIPEGWGVDADRLAKTLGSKSVRAARDPAPGQPLLVLYGSVGVGSVKVRTGSPRDYRRIARAVRRRALER